MQWNVWMHEKKENVLQLISTHKPDIICMQELTVDSPFQGDANVAEYLARELSYNQVHKIIPNGTPDGIGAVANGILSCLPIVSSRAIWIRRPKKGGTDFENQYRLYIEIEVEVEGRPLTVGTTHLSYTDRFEDISERQSEADALIEIARQKSQRYILTGDFNAPPAAYVPQSLDTFMNHAGPAYGVPTWTTKPHSYRGFEETELNWRLDYIFTTPDLETIASRAIITDYSDHLPIIASLAV